jgi:predicted nuclease of predicted toxin-antitoxin system
MKILLDMNLAPSWVVFLQEERFEAVHWSTVGDPRARDITIMEWARRGGYVVFTHDLRLTTTSSCSGGNVGPAEPLTRSRVVPVARS